MFNVMIFFVTIVQFFVALNVCVTSDISDYNVTIHANSTALLYCLNHTVLNIINISVEGTQSRCHRPRCHLTEYDTQIIENNCNSQQSCEFSSTNLTESTKNCVETYGHVDITYFCQGVVEYSCDFQTDFPVCGWIAESNNILIWERGRGETSSSGTGPEMDHSYANSSGYYAFVDATDCRSVYDFSNLTSGKITPTGSQCLSFWYHMYGDHISSLGVHKVSNGSFTELWSMTGNQGEMWYNEKISLDENYPYIIIFKATCSGKNQYKGDIAIDDVLITNRPCQESELDCSFEKNLCGWTTDTSMPYFWERNNGETQYTYVCHDHTTGSAIGSYIYLDSFYMQENSKVFLNSTVVHHYGQTCFSFWYHMYGSGIGTLNVYLANENSSLVWSTSGNKGNKWLYVTIDVVVNGNFRIIFEGLRGDNENRGIAIDDIVWTPGLCNGSICFSQTCSDLNHPIILHGCPRHYLETNKLILKFHSAIEGCSNEYLNVQKHTSLMCYNRDDTSMCFLDINSNSKRKIECFTDNRLKVDYTCAVKPLPVVGPSHSVELSAGTVAAIVICVLVLILIAVLVIIFVFRRKHHPKTNKYESSFIGAENKSYNHVVYKSENTSKEHKNETYENVSDKSCSSAEEKNTYFEFKSSVANSDLYKSSAEGTYDVSNAANHKEMETNLYSHTTDNVYDTTHQRQKYPHREDTYDHFSS